MKRFLTSKVVARAAAPRHLPLEVGTVRVGVLAQDAAALVELHLVRAHEHAAFGRAGKVAHALHRAVVLA